MKISTRLVSVKDPGDIIREVVRSGTGAVRAGKKIMRGIERRPSERSAEDRTLRAVRFPDEASFLYAVQLMSEQDADTPLDYELAINDIAVLPEWSYKRLAPLLAQRDIPYVDVELGSFTDLSPAKQAEVRGLIWKMK